MAVIRRTRPQFSTPILACLEVLRRGPSAEVWTFCKTATVDACERRGLIRDTGRRDTQMLRVFELTAAGREALRREPSLVGRSLWDPKGGMGVE